MSSCHEVKNCSSLKELITPFEYNQNPLPYYGILSLTNRCNLACSYCFHNQTNIDIDFKTADNAVKYLISNATIQNEKATVVFFGGEPLLMFEEIIVPLINKYGNSVNWSITTNGTLLTTQIIDFLTNNNVSILLSIDGCKEVQDLQRPLKTEKSSFEKIRDISAYLLLKQPDTIFRSTLTKHSLNYLDKNIKTAVDLGFKYINFIPNLYEDWNEDDYEKWENFIDNEAIKVLQNVCWENPFEYILMNLRAGVQDIIFSNINPYLKNPTTSCGMGLYGIGISPTGELHPCQEENGLNEIETIGNIYEGIDCKKQELYMKNIYNKWLKYIDNIDQINNSSNFKLFYANSFCNTRIKNDRAFCLTQEYFLSVIHHACSRLYYNLHLSLNPIAQLYLETGEI